MWVCNVNINDQLPKMPVAQGKDGTLKTASIWQVLMKSIIFIQFGSKVKTEHGMTNLIKYRLAFTGARTK